MEEFDQLLDRAWKIRESDGEAAGDLALRVLPHYEKANAAGPQVRAQIILSYAMLHRHSLDEAIDRAQQALTISRAHGLHDQSVEALRCLGIAFHKQGAIPEAQLHLHEALKICDEHGYDRSRLLMNIGNIHRSLGDYPGSLDYLKQALDAVSGEQERCLIHTNMGVTYAKIHEYDNALEHHSKSLEISRQLGDKRRSANALSNIAAIYSRQKNYPKAVKTYREALKAYQETGFQAGIAAAHSNIADAFIRLEHFSEAILHLEKSVELYSGLDYISRLAVSCTNLASAYTRSGRTAEAAALLPRIEELILQLQEKNYLTEIHQELADIYERTGDSGKSYEHFREYHRLDKEIFNEESDRRLKNLQIIHQVEDMKKDKEKAELEAEKLRQENEHKTRQLMMIAAHLMEKTKMIEDMTDYLEEKLDSVDRTVKDVRQVLRFAKNKLKLGASRDQDWRIFEEQFNQVHPSFTANILKRAPELSPMELKVAMLIRLQFGNDDIANILHISKRTVEFHRGNIRDKLSLGSGNNLGSEIMAI